MTLIYNGKTAQGALLFDSEGDMEKVVSKDTIVRMANLYYQTFKRIQRLPKPKNRKEREFYRDQCEKAETRHAEGLVLGETLIKIGASGINKRDNPGAAYFMRYARFSNEQRDRIHKQSVAPAIDRVQAMAARRRRKTSAPRP